MPLLPDFPNAFTWRALLVFGIYTALIGIAQGFTLHPHSLVVGTMVLATMLVIAHVYTYWRPRPQFAYPAMMVAYLVVNGVVFGSMSYFAAGFNRPLWDGALASLDPLVGFDWRAMQQATAASPLLSNVGNLIYHTSLLEIFLVWAVLGLTGQLRRLSVFLTAMVLSAGVCLMLAGVFPAAGAYTHFVVPESAMGYLKGTRAGLWHMQDFEALRSGALRSVDLSRLEGIVTFPSFHTVVAMMCGWALARTRYIGIPAVIYSGLIILTVLPIGGHYLFDVVVGAAIMAASVVVAYRVEGDRRFPEATAAGAATTPVSDTVAA